MKTSGEILIIIALICNLSLNKVYAFAFMRFVVRMAQRNWLRSKKTIDKTTENMLISEDIEDSDQMK